MGTNLWVYPDLYPFLIETKGGMPVRKMGRTLDADVGYS
jgi:hypothetical protein